jgi:hypothetical protein
MNKDRREKLRVIAEKISDLKGEIEELKDEEQDAFDNMPEGLQQAERGVAMEAVVDMLDDAMNDMDSVITALEGAQE